MKIVTKKKGGGANLRIQTERINSFFPFPLKCSSINANKLDPILRDKHLCKQSKVWNCHILDDTVQYDFLIWIVCNYSQLLLRSTEAEKLWKVNKHNNFDWSLCSQSTMLSSIIECENLSLSEVEFPNNMMNWRQIKHIRETWNDLPVFHLEPLNDVQILLFSGN